MSTQNGEVSGLKGRGQAVLDLKERMKKIAFSDFTVLITGEHGTGKELVAREINRNSRRKNKPFVAINCAAIPESLFENELFGHVKGAFTGALKARDGLFKAADGGTLFLDEIGDLPIYLQAKLLRALQEKEIKPVGADKSIKVDVRVIAATNRDLAKMVDENLFRADLYYRLEELTLETPP